MTLDRFVCPYDGDTCINDHVFTEALRVQEELDIELKDYMGTISLCQICSLHKIATQLKYLRVTR